MQRRVHTPTGRPDNPFSRGGPRLTYKSDVRYGPQTNKIAAKRNPVQLVSLSCVVVLLLYGFVSWCTSPATPSRLTDLKTSATRKPVLGTLKPSDELGYKPRLKDNEEERIPYHRPEEDEDGDHTGDTRKATQKVDQRREDEKAEHLEEDEEEENAAHKRSAPKTDVDDTVSDRAHNEDRDDGDTEKEKPDTVKQDTKEKAVSEDEEMKDIEINSEDKKEEEFVLIANTTTTHEADEEFPKPDRDETDNDESTVTNLSSTLSKTSLGEVDEEIDSEPTETKEQETALHKDTSEPVQTQLRTSEVKAIDEHDEMPNLPDEDGKDPSDLEADETSDPEEQHTRGDDQRTTPSKLIGVSTDPSEVKSTVMNGVNKTSYTDSSKNTVEVTEPIDASQVKDDNSTTPIENRGNDPTKSTEDVSNTSVVDMEMEKAGDEEDSALISTGSAPEQDAMETSIPASKVEDGSFLNVHDKAPKLPGKINDDGNVTATTDVHSAGGENKTVLAGTESKNGDGLDAESSHNPSDDEGTEPAEEAVSEVNETTEVSGSPNTNIENNNIPEGARTDNPSDSLKEDTSDATSDGKGNVNVGEVADGDASEATDVGSSEKEEGYEKSEVKDDSQGVKDIALPTTSENGDLDPNVEVDNGEDVNTTIAPVNEQLPTAINEKDTTDLDKDERPVTEDDGSNKPPKITDEDSDPSNVTTEHNGDGQDTEFVARVSDESNEETHAIGHENENISSVGIVESSNETGTTKNMVDFNSSVTETLGNVTDMAILSEVKGGKRGDSTDATLQAADDGSDGSKEVVIAANQEVSDTSIVESTVEKGKITDVISDASSASILQPKDEENQINGTVGRDSNTDDTRISPLALTENPLSSKKLGNNDKKLPGTGELGESIDEGITATVEGGTEIIESIATTGDGVSVEKPSRGDELANAGTEVSGESKSETVLGISRTTESNTGRLVDEAKGMESQEVVKTPLGDANKTDPSSTTNATNTAFVELESENVKNGNLRGVTSQETEAQ
jgi:hypothetical protein